MALSYGQRIDFSILWELSQGAECGAKQAAEQGSCPVAQGSLGTETLEGKQKRGEMEKERKCQGEMKM